MKKFLIIILLAFSLVSAIDALPVAYAATPYEYCSEKYPEPRDNEENTAFYICLEDAAGTSGEEATAVAPIDPAASKIPTGEEIRNIGVVNEILAVVMQWLASLFAWLVTAAMIVLNYSVYFTVVKMGSYVNSIDAIGVSWRILRDLGNIVLIFGFLLIGISTIIGHEIYGWKTKMLPTLLIVAVALNFSLFAAQAVIDTGNMFATQFYKQINGGALPAYQDLAKDNLSGKIMSQLGLANIYDAAKTDSTKLFKENSIFIGFMSILLFVVLAFVMFAIALMFIARFVYLVFLMILSPIGIAGFAFPKLESKAREWWKHLFEQTITAPVMMLLLYIALAVINDKGFLAFGQRPEWTGATGASLNMGGYAAAMLSFLTAMGLLLFVIVAAKNLSAAGAGWATKTAGKLSFGVTGLAGRYTLGLGANKFGKYIKSTPLARVPLVGTGFVKGLDKLAGSSFDVRGTKVLKNFPGGSIDAGDAHKGGYKDDLKKAVESRTKYAADLKGKDFKDLTEEDQLSLAKMQRQVEFLQNERKNATDPEDYKKYGEWIKKEEEKIEKFNKEKGTEVGNKLKYAETLSKLPLGFKYLASNKEASKKIKEEAKKSKDDKELETLRKALKKMGDEPEGGAPPAAPASAATGTPSGTAPKA
jgi:hypothetical protein